MTSRSFGGHHGLRGHQNGNIYIHTRVIEVADIKSDVKIGLLTIAARSSIGPLPSCFNYKCWHFFEHTCDPAGSPSANVTDARSASWERYPLDGEPVLK